VTVLTSGGSDYSLFDVEYLYDCRRLLSPRQAQAIEFCLYQNMREKDVAIMMGLSEGSPVAIYAAQGLRRLCSMIEAGEIPRYRPEPEAPGPQPVPGLERALNYALAGIPVVPLWWAGQDGRCPCGGAGSLSCAPPHPVLPAWRDRATTDRTMLARWWGSWPQAGVGLVLRAYGSSVLGGDLLRGIPAPGGFSHAPAQRNVQRPGGPGHPVHQGLL
jgi:hypothetical protein